MINTLISGLLGSLALVSVAAFGFYRSPSLAPRPGETAPAVIRMSRQDETFEPLRFGASEGDKPRRGRPGIVVFSGGTAFNAASGRWL